MVKRLWWVLFIILTGCDSRDVKTYFTPGPDCENHIIAELNATKHTADIAVYSITNKKIAAAILSAHNRGVHVRVITDRAQAKIKSAATIALQDAGIIVITNKKHKIMHHKFAIFDGRRAVSGSYNWTENASLRNAENCDFFDLSDNRYILRFEYLWNFY